jgi:hypothetical protein
MPRQHWIQFAQGRKFEYDVLSDQECRYHGVYSGKTGFGQNLQVQRFLDKFETIGFNVL